MWQVMVMLRVLGSFTAESDAEPIPLGGPRQRGVLALLVAARGQVVPVDRMVEDLWRGEAPARALASLQAYISNLRRLLEPGRPPRTPARLLVSAAPGYALRLPRTAVDAWRFEEMIEQARTHTDSHAVRDLLEDALALWQGPAFAEFADEPWAVTETTRLGELRLVARELHIATRLRLDHPPRSPPIPRPSPANIPCARRLGACTPSRCGAAAAKPTPSPPSAAPAPPSPTNSASTPAPTWWRWRKRSSPSAPTSSVRLSLRPGQIRAHSSPNPARFARPQAPPPPTRAFRAERGVRPAQTASGPAKNRPR